MLEQLSPEELQALQQEQQEALNVIRTKNIITVTATNRSPPIQQQANPEFTSLESLHKRSQLTLNDEMQKVFSLLWAIPDLEKANSGEQLTKSGYFKIMRAVHQALQQKQLPSNKLDALIARDYEDDLAKFGELNKQNFCRSLFELVDLWCNSLESELYAAFAWALVVNIVDPSSGKLKKGKIRCVFNASDDAMLALWREDNKNRRVDALRADILLRIPEVMARIQSRKKAKVFDATDIQQLKAMSKKMGLEFGNATEGDDHQPPRRYKFVENPLLSRKKSTGSTSGVGAASLSSPTSPGVEGGGEYLAAAPQLTIVTTTSDTNEPAQTSNGASVSGQANPPGVPTAHALHDQFCPAIVITRPVTESATTTKPTRHIDIMEDAQAPPSLHPRVASARAPSRSTNRKKKTMTTTKPDDSLYMLQRQRSATKRRLTQATRAVSAPTGQLRLAPARVLLENTGDAMSRKQGPVNSAPVVVQALLPNHLESDLPSSLMYYYSQCSEHNEDNTEVGVQTTTTVTDETAYRPNQPLIVRSWSWVKLQPGSLQPTPVESWEESNIDDAEGSRHTTMPIRAQSAPALHSHSIPEIAGHRLLPTSCEDIPREQRRSRTRKLRRRQKVTRPSTSPATIAARVAAQQLALDQWYRSRDFQRLF